MNLKTKAAYKIELEAFTKAMALKDWPSAWLAAPGSPFSQKI